MPPQQTQSEGQLRPTTSDVCGLLLELLETIDETQVFVPLLTVFEEEILQLLAGRLGIKPTNHCSRTILSLGS